MDSVPANCREPDVYNSKVRVPTGQLRESGGKALPIWKTLIPGSRAPPGYRGQTFMAGTSSFMAH
jgi:hypothetical protein